jgi:hypothetical protein
LTLGIHFALDIAGSKHNVILVHTIADGYGEAREMEQAGQYNARACSYVTKVSTAGG